MVTKVPLFSFGGHLFFVPEQHSLSLLANPLGHILHSLGGWSTKVSYQGHVGPATVVSFPKSTVTEEQEMIESKFKK